MSDKDSGDAGFLLNSSDFFPGLESQTGIQVGQRLVQQKNPGHLYQCPGNGHALLLTAGQFTGFAIHETVDLNQLGSFQCHFCHLCFGQLVLSFAIFQREGDVLLNSQMGVQGIILEHKTHTTVFRRQIGHILITKENLAGGGLLQTRQ